MKHIRNWKIYKDNVELNTALDILRQGQTIGGHHPIAIKHNKTGKFIEQINAYKDEPVFKINELDDNWMILVPDDARENKNEKLRKLVKNSNCSGLNYDKIDNMNIHEIFEYIASHLTEDQEYRWLLSFYKDEIFKTNK